MADIKPTDFKQVAIIPLRPYGENYQVLKPDCGKVKLYDDYVGIKVMSLAHEQGCGLKEYGTADSFVYGNRPGTMLYSKRNRRGETPGGEFDSTPGITGTVYSTAAGGGAATAAGFATFGAASAAGAGTVIAVVSGVGVFIIVAGAVGYVAYKLGETTAAPFEEAGDNSQIQVSVREGKTGPELAVSYFSDGNDISQMHGRLGSPVSYPKASVTQDAAQSFIYSLDADGNWIKRSSNLVGSSDANDDYADIKNLRMQSMDSALDLKSTDITLSMVGEREIPSSVSIKQSDPLYQVLCSAEIAALMKTGNRDIQDHATKLAIAHLSKFNDKNRTISPRATNNYNDNVKMFELILNIYADGLKSMEASAVPDHQGFPCRLDIRGFGEAITIGRSVLGVKQELYGDALNSLVNFNSDRRNKVAPFMPLFTIGENGKQVTHPDLQCLHDFATAGFATSDGRDLSFKIVGEDKVSGKNLRDLQSSLVDNRKQILRNLFAQASGPKLRDGYLDLSGNRLEYFRTSVEQLGLKIHDSNEDGNYSYKELLADLNLNSSDWDKIDQRRMEQYQFAMKVRKQILDRVVGDSNGEKAHDMDHGLKDKLFDFLAKAHQSNGGFNVNDLNSLMNHIKDSVRLSPPEEIAMRYFFHELYHGQNDPRHLGVLSAANRSSAVDFTDNFLIDNLWNQNFLSDSTKATQRRMELGVTNKNELAELIFGVLIKLDRAGHTIFIDNSVK